MKYLKQKFLIGFFGATFLMGMIVSTFPGIIPKAAASGETYNWNGATQIDVKGGQTAAKADSKGNMNPNDFTLQTAYLPGPQPITLHTTLYFYPNIQTNFNAGNGNITEYGCKVAATLTLQSSTAGVINVTVVPPPPPGVTSIGSPQPDCSQSQVDGLGINNQTINITGFVSNTESDAQKSVDIFVSSPAQGNSSVPAIQGTLKDANGNVVSGPDTGKLETNPANQIADYPFHYELTEGDYSFCASQFLTACHPFHKTKYQPLIITLGEDYTTRDINFAIVESYYAPSWQDITVGPAEVQMFDSSGNLIKDQTAPANTLKGIPMNQGVAYRSGTVSTYIDFQNMDPGTYKICVLVLNRCTTVTKVAGTSGKGEVDITMDDQAQLAYKPRSPDCYISNDPLSWVICPVFNGIARASNWIFTNLLTPLLVTEPVGLSSGDASFQVWSNFRIYGDIILVLAVIILILGQSITGGLAETYNLKKMLPRVLLIAILINLSIYIVAFMVDITNILGRTIGDVMTDPIRAAGQWSFSPNAVQGVGVFAVGLIGFLVVGGSIIGTLTALFFSGTTGSAAFLKVALYAAMFVLIPIFLAIVAVFVTLIIRKGLILFLIMVSPVWLALYCLPNTQQYGKKGFDLLKEALAVYPVIVVIFAISDILAVTTLTANNIQAVQLTSHSSTGSLALSIGQIIAILFALLMQFLPLFAIPFSFRIAGSTLSRAQDALTAGAAKVGEMTQNRRDHAKHEFNVQKMQGQQTAYNAINKFGDQHRWAKRIPIIGTKGLGRVAGGYNIEAAMSAEQARSDKEIQDMVHSGNPDAVLAARALTANKSTSTEANGRMKIDVASGDRMFKTAAGEWVSEALVDEAYRRWGGNHFAQQSALAFEMSKATSQDQIDSLVSSFPALSHRWGMSNGQANNAWIGAGFANQETNLEYRYTSLNNNGQMELNGRNMMIDVDEKRGGYKMAHQNAEAWTSMQQEYKKAQATMANATATADERTAARDTLQRGSRIARTMIMQLPDGSSTINTSGAAGRVAQEMENFARMAHPGATVAKPSTYAAGHEGQHEQNIYQRRR